MLKTVTATYRSRDALRNVVDDLLSVGIERERIYADDVEHIVKVRAPDDIQPEVLEILGRHDPLHLN